MNTSDTAAMRATLPAPDGRVDASRATQAGITILVAVLVIGPLLPILVQALRSTPLYEAAGHFTFAAFGRLLAHPQFAPAVGNTLVFAALATVVAQVIGVSFALLVVRTNLPGRGLIGGVFLWPLYVSHLVLAFGWILAFGPAGIVTGWAGALVGLETGTAAWNLYTMGGLALAAGSALAPLTYLYCVSSLQTIDPALEAAAQIAGASAPRALITVTLPLLRPAVLGSTMLNFVLAVELLALPLLLGGPVGLHFLTTFIYGQGLEASSPDLSVVAACAVLLIGLVTLLVLLQTWLTGDTRRFVTVGGKAARQRPLDLGRLRWPAALLLGAYVLLTVGAVLGAIGLRAITTAFSPYTPLAELLTWGNFTALADAPEYLRSVWNTLILGVGGGAIATLLIAATAIVALRSDWPLARPLEFVALYPRAIPALLVSIGVFWAAAWMPGGRFVQGTLWILLIAFVMRHLPTGYGVFAPSLLQIGRDLDRAARVTGASWLAAMRAVILPQLRTPLAACFLLLFVSIVKEYAAAVFLYGPGTEILGTTMLTFWVQGEHGAVAALAVVQIVIVAVAVALMRGVFKVKLYG